MTEKHEIQVLFMALGWFSSTFQGKFHFQEHFNIDLHFQVLFKPVRTLTDNVPRFI